MTNLLQHSTCTLDISSDEESERRASREKAEGRDKENIPPADDVSQTSARARAQAAFDDDKMALDKARGPLVEMNASDYYPEGCDGDSVFFVLEDEGEDFEEAETVIGADEPLPELPPLPEQRLPRVTLAEDSFEFAPQVQLPEEVTSLSVDALMGKDLPAAKAAVLEPIEGTGESFVLWESQSSHDPASPRDIPGSPAPDSDMENQSPVEEAKVDAVQTEGVETCPAAVPVTVAC